MINTPIVDEVRTYRIAKGWAIFLYIFCPLVIIFFTGLALASLFPSILGEDGPGSPEILVPISLGVIALMAFGIRDLRKGKFVIDRDSIYSVTSFGTRKLMFNQIKGFRTHEKYIFVEPNEKGLKRIRLSTYLGNSDEILAWLGEHYPDLDEQAEEEEKQEILADERFGTSEEEREEKLLKAHKVAKFINYPAIGVAVYNLFIADPYEPGIIAGIAIPLIAIIAIKFHKGLIRIGAGTRSAYPSLLIAVFASAAGLLIRALMDFNLLEYATVWKIVIAATLALTVLVLVGGKEFDLSKAEGWLGASLIALAFMAFSFGAVVTLNCAFDESTPIHHTAVVTGKHVTNGKTTTYSFNVTPWGPFSGEDDVDVSEDLYKRVEVEDEINVYEKKGLLNIGWFLVTD